MTGQKIFNEIIKDTGIKRDARRGRNNSLIHKRNESLITRYYYYASIKNKCYEDIMRQLMIEFFVSPATIAHIVQENADHLQFLKQKGPTLHYFQNKWPHLKW